MTGEAGGGGDAIGALFAGDTSTPSRLVDSRTSASMRSGDILVVNDVAAANQGVVFNLAATDTTGYGNLTVYPCAEGRSTVSALNFSPAGTVSNGSIVATDDNDDICIYAKVADEGAVHVVVDRFGTQVHISRVRAVRTVQARRHPHRDRPDTPNR